MTAFVANLRHELLFRGWTAAELARRAGLPVRMVQLWLSKGSRVSVEDAYRVCQVLKRPMEAMLGSIVATERSESRMRLDSLLDQLSDDDREELAAMSLVKIERRGKSL